MSKQYNADLFVKNGGLSTEVLMADGGVSPSSDFVNETSTFLPINTSGAFTDSPIFATKVLGGDGYKLLETKINALAEFPLGGIEASPSWGISAELNFVSDIQRVQLGDFDGYQGTGKFEWSTGGIAPSDSSYIKFDTYGQDHFVSANSYFQLDANVGNPSRVDGALWDSNFSGLYGFGKGLDSSTGDSSEGALWWNLNTGDFEIKGSFSDTCFFSNISIGQTYIQSQSSKLGLELTSMYITNDLTDNSAIGSTEVTKLRVRDNQGNVYAIKLFPYI